MRTISDREPRTSTSTFTQLVSSGVGVGGRVRVGVGVRGGVGVGGSRGSRQTSMPR